jgi:drug/metabolite transporter (DMT)-like permease
MAELKVVLTMALVQLLYSVYNLLVRASLVTGINPVVFAVYRDLLALLMLWPLAFFLERRLWTRISPTVLIMLLFSGITGVYAFQVLALLGLAYTSAPLIAGIQNMTPVFTFIIGVVFRIETIRYSRPSGQAQILGFLACVGGAVTMSLYKGPVIFPNLLTSTRASGSTNFQDQGLDIVISEGLKKFIVEWKIDSWKFGSFCGIASSFLINIYINLQVCALVLVCYLGTVQ